VSDERLPELFEEASALHPDGRRQLLDRLRRESPALADELARLLANPEGEPSPIDVPAIARHLQASDEPPPPERVGPYRLVRHPIYFGLLLFTLGEAFSFGSWPAVMIVLSGIAPTFAWRARAEEKLLSRTFGDGYAAYRRRTRMIVPYLC